MSKARGHHFLPQCYLKGFARSDGQLYALDLKKKEGYFTSPLNLCKQRDFNRIDSEGVEPNAIEDSLAKFESCLAPPLKRVCAARGGDNLDDWIYVLNLMALITARNPSARENFRAFKTRMIEILMDMHLHTKERWESTLRAARRDGHVSESLRDPTYEEMKKFIDDKRYKIEFPRGDNTVAEFGAVDAALQLLGRREWKFIAAPPGSVGFVTSDHPVCLMHANGSVSTLGRPVGHAIANTFVIFSVCSRLAVVGSFEGDSERIVASHSYVAQLNTIIALFADRHVIGASDQVTFLLDQETVGRGEEVIPYIKPRDD